MPLFLTPEVYIPLPLERTYESAWEAVPAYWRGPGCDGHVVVIAL